MANPHTAPERIAGALSPSQPFAEHSRSAALPSRFVAITARVWAARLDRALLAGADPTTDALLHRRALQLTTRRTRTRLADALEAHLDEARRAAPRGRGPSVPLCRGEVLRAAPELRRVVACLRGGGEVRAQGIARLRRLLSNGHGPLYQHSPPGTLARAVAAATAGLCDAC